MHRLTAESLLALLAGLSLTDCKGPKPAIQSEPAASVSAPVAANEVPAASAAPAPSGGAVAAPSASVGKGEGKCSPGGCAPGKCG